MSQTICTFQILSMIGPGSMVMSLKKIPKDAPEPLGKSVATTKFLDANLLHDLITGRFVTAVLHFFNLTPGGWYSKRQATVENASYASEFVAAKTATEQIVDIRQTLRYLGVPIKSKAYMFGVILPRTRVIFSVNTGNSPRYFTSSETSLTSKER